MALVDTINTSTPQFDVTIDGQRGKVLFNGIEVKNVRRVSVSNDVDAVDVIRSTITIELVGEPVLMKVGVL
jgi:hypothetical protein